ncbi:MAG: S-layer homology domain-containing protein [Bacillota bacterium]|nr:S-layer homology domain-containing protein [Bacillota bacterium]
MKKKILAILVILVLALPVFAAAETETCTFTLTIPYIDANADGVNDYTAEVGTLKNYYVYSYLDSTSRAVEDEKETLTFNVQKDNTYFYKVLNLYNEDSVSYGNYISISNDTAQEVTKANMYVDVTDGADHNKDTVIRDFSENSCDVADIYLNINSKGYLDMAKGGEYTVYPLRNWLAIESYSNAQVIEPDFHYQVINIEGNNVVTVSENQELNSSRHSAVITAQNEGTAIILVTYDAMSAMGYGNKEGTFYSSIWPENSGVIVVSVDGNHGFDTGMKLNAGKNTADKKLSGDAIDSEFDVLYYTGDNGAEYTFTPDTGTSVTVMRPTYSDGKMTFSGEFSSQGVTVGGDGSVTLTGLVQGSNIVKCVNGNKTEYQIVRAKKVSYTMSYTRGDTSIPASELSAGDTVNIKFDTVYHPANKLSGYYNNTAKIYYTGEDGSTFGSTPNQYSFATEESAQTLSVTIPQNWTGGSYTLKEGCIMTGGYGYAFGSHREITYENGKEEGFDGVLNETSFGNLPDITVALKEDSSGTTTGNINVKVSAYDYTAVKAGVAGASGTGVILNKYTVSVPAGTAAGDAVAKAFKENNITSEGISGGYVNKINELGAGAGYAGWCMSYDNDDYSNAGLGDLTLKNGDEIRFDYSCNFDDFTDDIGNGWYGLPILTEFKLGGQTFKMSRESSYYSNYNLTAKYYDVTGGTKKDIKGSGTSDDPFVISLETSADITSLTAQYKTSLDKHYLKVTGIDGKKDYSDDVKFSVSTLGGKYITYYCVKVTKIGGSGGATTGSNTKETTGTTPIQQTTNVKKTAAFKDIIESSPYKEAVEYVYDTGIMNGISEDEFEPDGQMTRAMFVMILYRMAGKPAVQGNALWKDTDSKAWYGSAVSWAAGNALVNGYDSETFGVNDSVTYEQLVLIMLRYAHLKNMGDDVINKVSSYDDGKETEFVLRADIAQIIMSFSKKVSQAV